MATPNINLTAMDFDDIKNNLKMYLRSQSTFQDYDFDGSNMSVILDILAYNTYLNNFYLNMVGSEMFLSTAQQRDSAVLRAKELNYLPSSFRSAVANINLTISPSNYTSAVLAIPKGTSFTGKFGANNYTFVTDEMTTITQDPVTGNFFANNLSIYEGQYVTETFNVNYSLEPQKFVLSDPKIDISSLTLISAENNGANLISYTFSSSLLDVKNTSPVFFLQGTENNKYQFYFGDNNIGRKPADGAVIIAEYRIPNGELPNGVSTFSLDAPINGQQNVTVTVNQAAQGGSISESTESIQYYAPLSYATQDRAITQTDYETLLKSKFPEISAISVYGGETLTPPQYGKVFISLAIKNYAGIPDTKQTEYGNYISARAPTTITPVFVLPNYLYVRVKSTVNYNINMTALSPNDISTLVASAVQTYNTTYLNDFKTTLHYSKIVEAIDATTSSIVSNETDVDMFIKVNPTTNGIPQNFTVNFNTELENTVPPIPLIHGASQIHAVSSSKFLYEGKFVELEDDSQGNIRLVTSSNGLHYTLQNVGTVNYDTGVVTITNLIVSSYFGDSIRIYATPRNKDFASTQNTILTIANDEINLTVNQVRI